MPRQISVENVVTKRRVEVHNVSLTDAYAQLLHVLTFSRHPCFKAGRGRIRRVLSCNFTGFEKSERHDWIGRLCLGG